MCGIAGITNKNLDNKGDIIQLMTDAIIHRGPDDSGFFVDDDGAIGMRRLSIIDISGGKQPISSFDDRYFIIFNGEIYNYKELREQLLADGEEFKTESDTEVILRLFEREGESCVIKLRGMFAFAIYDTEEKKIFLARDYFGIKPLYYYKKDNRVEAFSSEIKSFLSYPNFKAEVNDEAVFNYLSYQYNPLEESFFKGVFKLPPAHFMTVDLETGESEIQRYWQFSLRPDESLSKGEAEDKIREVMRDSVRHHMIADVPVGSFLSGGIDSSIIATLMQEIRTEEAPKRSKTNNVKTFTIGFENVSEASEARETAEPLGTDHREINIGRKKYFQALDEVVRHFDEPVADPSALGLFFLAEEARKEVKVVLSGEGSDELFGGYNIYLEPFARQKIGWLPESVLKFIVGLPFEFRGKNWARRASKNLQDWYIGNASIFEPKEVEKIWKYSPQEKFSIQDLYKQVQGMSDSAKMQYIDIHTWLVGDILAKADKMTMAHSLELRVPFLDIEVARFASRLPDKLKWHAGVTKFVLREAFKNILPESTRKRKKLGFPTPVREWFKDKDSEIYKTILENPYILSRFDSRLLRELFAQHIEGKKDNSRKIYLLLMLSTWYNVFKPAFSK